MKKCAWLAVGVLSLIVTGCGGGSGGGSASIPPPGDSPFSSGSFEGRAAATNPPVTTSAQTTVATGITGNLSQLKLRDQNLDLNDVRIAVSSARTAPTDLYTCSPSGADFFRITNTPGEEQDVAFSPAGNKIAVSVQSPGHLNDIFIYRSDGVLLDQVTNTPSATETHPTWSPDGTKLLFETGTGLITLYDTTTKASSTLPTGVGDAYQPDWSSTNLIAFMTTRDGGHHIYTMSPNGTNLRATLSNGNETLPKWDPNGTRLYAIEGNSAIWEETLRGDGGHSSDVPFGFTFTAISKPYLTPDGDNFLVLSSTNAIMEVQRVAGGSATMLYQSFDDILGFEPAPLIKDRLIMGSGGLLAPSGAGFIYADAGNKTQCCLVFDATTRSSVILRAMTGIGGSEDSLVFSLDADTVKLIKYANAPIWNAVSVVESGTSTPTANGALISIDSAFGRVNAVLPFNGSRAADSKPTVTRQGSNYVFTGKFTSVVNGAGKNVAPNGASRVVLDPKTGTLTAS